MTTTAIARSISDLESIGGLNGTDIANVTDVSKATVSRWRNGTKRPQPTSERVLSDLIYVVRRLEDYYSNDEIRLWLYARHPQLEGQRAIDLIHAVQPHTPTDEIGHQISNLDHCGHIAVNEKRLGNDQT